MRGGVRSRRCWGCTLEKFWGVAPHGIFDEPKRIIVQCAANAVILMQVPFLFYLLASMQQLGLVLQKLPYFLVSTPSPKIIPRCLCKHMKNMKYWVSSIEIYHGSLQTDAPINCYIAVKLNAVTVIN